MQGEKKKKTDVKNIFYEKITKKGMQKKGGLLGQGEARLRHQKKRASIRPRKGQNIWLTTLPRRDQEQEKWEG